MPTAEEYILSFDLHEFSRQVSDFRQSYTDLGQAIGQVAFKVSENLQDLKKQADVLSSSLLEAASNLDTTYGLLNAQMRESASILDDIARSSRNIISDMASGMQTAARGTTTERDVLTQQDRARARASQVADVAPGAAAAIAASSGVATAEGAIEEAKDAAETAKDASETAKNAVKEAKKAGDQVQKEFKGVRGLIQKELTNAGRSARSIIRRMASSVGIVGGGLLGGLLGAMILGAREKDRIAAEAGEMTNIFESAVDGLGKKTTRTASKWFSDFAENAQRQYGIGRKESQAMAKAFVDAGYSGEEMLAAYDRKLGEVGANIPTMTLALEKHLNLASGSAAQNVTKLVAEYGNTLDAAADKFSRLAFAAQRSGIGIDKFVNSVMAGGQSLVQYGIELEDVAHVLDRLQKYYEGMGLGKKYAGAQAAAGVQGIMQGLANLDEGFKTFIATRMTGREDALEARQEFMEGWARVAAGEDDDFLIRFIKETLQAAKEATGGDRASTIEFLRRRGFEHQRATELYDLGENLEGNTKISKETRDQVKAFRKSFETEGKALGRILKAQRKLIKDMAGIGQGILKIVGGILGTLIIGFKSIPAFIKAWTMKPSDRDKALASIDRALQVQYDSVKSGISDVQVHGKSFFSDLADSLGVFSNALGKAVSFKVPKAKDLDDAVAEAGRRKLQEAAGAVAGKAFGKDVGRDIQRQLQLDYEESQRKHGAAVQKNVQDIVDRPLSFTGGGVEEGSPLDKFLGWADKVAGPAMEKLTNVNVTGRLLSRDIQDAVNRVNGAP